MKKDLTFLGIIQKVVGNRVFVEISQDIPSFNLIINGKTYRIGQIGSFVRIPLGFNDVYGIISMVGSFEKEINESETIGLKNGQRWLELNLFGESNGKHGFERGISTYPTINDEVHLVTEDDLATIYDFKRESMINIGHHASSQNLVATIDINKIVNRHGAILGSTGSGKSNTVAAILESINKKSLNNSRIIIIDPHGEYGSVFLNHAKTYSINTENALKIPFWILSFDELGSILVDRKTASSSQQDTILRDRIFELKSKNCSNLKSGNINCTDITVDSPIPFDIKKMWYDLYLEDQATLYKKDDWTSIAFKVDNEGNEKRGDIANVIPPEFLPPGTGSTPPFRSTKNYALSSYLTKIMGRLRDKRYNFLFNVDEFDGCNKDLHDLLNDWIGHDKPITILDLSGIPFEIMDLIVGTVSRIIYECMFWGKDINGMGRQRPILFVFEEAHSYLPKSNNNQFVSGYANHAVRRIFKEGRKYGIGALIVSQRPSDIDESIISQCGTFFALRLTNSQDQSMIKTTIPDSMSSLMDLLPTLRTGEAIIVGEGVKMPCRIRLPLIEPRPKSSDTEVTNCWSKLKELDCQYDIAVTKWRTQDNSNSSKVDCNHGKDSSQLN